MVCQVHLALLEVLGPLEPLELLVHLEPLGLVEHLEPLVQLAPQGILGLLVLLPPA